MTIGDRLAATSTKVSLVGDYFYSFMSRQNLPLDAADAYAYALPDFYEQVLQ